MSYIYSEKLLDHAKPSATNAFETVQKENSKKKSEATGDLISNKIE